MGSAFAVLQAIKRNICTWRRQKPSSCSIWIQTCRQRRVQSGTAHALLNSIWRGVLDTRMNSDTRRRDDSIRIRICVDAETFKSGKKSPRIQKYPDTCGRGLRMHMSMLMKRSCRSVLYVDNFCVEIWNACVRNSKIKWEINLKSQSMRKSFHLNFD